MDIIGSCLDMQAASYDSGDDSGSGSGSDPDDPDEDPDKSWTPPRDECTPYSTDMMEVDAPDDNRGMFCDLFRLLQFMTNTMGFLAVSEFLHRTFTSHNSAAWSQELCGKAALWIPMLKSWARTL